MAILQVAGKHEQAEALESAEEELGRLAAILSACVSPNGYGVLEVFPHLCVACNNVLQRFYC